jgi:hypothetical protein
MSDLIIRESDGWDELEDFFDALRSSGAVKELWDAAASGDMVVVRETLEQMGYFDDEDDLRVVAFRIIAEPDDIHGDYYRAWVKTKG